MTYTIKLESIRLKNIKSVADGKIKINFDKGKCDIVGIYGANGTGKTAIIDAMEIIQNLFMGNALNNNIIDYLCVKENESMIETTFLVEFKGGKKYRTEYTIFLKLDVKGSTYFIKSEKLSSALVDGGEETVIECDFENTDDILIPKKWEENIADNSKLIRELFAEKIISKFVRASFIFNPRVANMLSGRGYNGGLFDVIKAIKQYAKIDLFIIKKTNSATISLNQSIPLNYRIENEGINSIKGEVNIRLDVPTVYAMSEYPNVNLLIAQLNLVLKCIIPDLQICLKEYGQQINEKGEMCMRFELLTQRPDGYLPLRSESEGIKKIISILSVLITFFNKESSTILIDELDASIYEYLLGEVLLVLDENAKGQLIFTSHNMRAVEILNKRNIYFTTCNPKNRYIQLKNVKDDKNLRKLYYRCIQLGGQEEKLYDETNLSTLALQFYFAGRDMHYEG